jgi:NDP-sugar pyrophosphorylase family protein
MNYHNKLIVITYFLVSLGWLSTLPVSFATSKEFCDPIGGPLSSDETNKEYTLIINDSGTIKDLNLVVDLNEHKHVGGLILTLKQGENQVTLIDQPGIPSLTPQLPETTKGCSGWNIPTVILDDEAINSIEENCNFAGEPAYQPQGLYRPNNLLSIFDGQDIQGTWTLSVQDQEPASPNGKITQWCLSADLILAGNPYYVSQPSPNETIQFPAVLVDGFPQETVVTQSIEISNQFGNAALEIYFQEITGDKDDFTVEVNPPPTTGTLLATIPAGTSDAITLACDATTWGERSATLKLATNDSDNSTVEYQLSCTGLGAAYRTHPPLQDNSIIFGDIPLVMTSPPIPLDAKIKTFQIQNTGNNPLIIKNIALIQADNKSDFKVIEPSSFPITLADKTSSLTVKLQCQPSALGTRQAKLEVMTNLSRFQGINEYRLQCNGIDADSSELLATYHSFPPPNDLGNPIEFNTWEDTSAEKTLFITEVGGRDLTISRIKLIEEASDSLPNYFSIDKDPSFFPFSIPYNDPNYFRLKITCKPSPKDNGGFLPQKVAKLQIFSYEGTWSDQLDEKESQKEYHLRCNVQPRLAGYQVTYQSPTNETISLKPGNTFYIGQSREHKIKSAQWETVARTLVIHNPKVADLEVALDNITPGFTIQNKEKVFSTPIANNEQRSVTVQCTPTKSAITTGQLTFNVFNLTPNKTQPRKFTYKLACLGIADRPAIYNSVPVKPNTTIDFGSVPIDTTQLKEVTIVEDGQSLLWVDLAPQPLSGPQASEFKLLDSPLPLFFPESSAGKETTFQVQCQPQAEGERRATLNLITNGWPSDQLPHQPLPSKRVEDLGHWSIKYDLICNGASTSSSSPGFASTPAPNSTIRFGEVTIGTSATRLLAIEEIGDEDLTIASAVVEPSSNFSIISPSIPLTIADGGAIQLMNIQCQPSAIGQHQAQLKLTTNDPNNSTVVYDLTCQGISTTPLPEANNLLVVKITGEGNGSVVSDPNGIQCNKNNNTSCSASFGGDAVVTLIPKAAPDSKFDHWSGDCNEQGQITIARRQSCTAHFQLLSSISTTLFKLSVSVSGEGKVTSNPTGISCGDGDNNCSFDYEEGTTVTLTTTFDATTWRFRGWNGCNWLSDNTIPVVMTAEQQCQAIFVPVSQSASQLDCPDTPILYVNQSASGNNTGLNWNDAVTDLPKALTIANHCDAVKQVWVAEGTYKPTTQTDRTATFQLLNGVAIYGGFSGTETQLQQRDRANHPTILSGDIGIVGNSDDNSYHVVNGSNTDETALLDGFTITAGQADGSQNCPLGCGGGVFNEQGSPTLQHLLVTNNSAYYGGGLANNASSYPTIKYSFFKNNTATGGGGMANINSSPVSDHVFFLNNTATQMGGGLLNQNNSQPQFAHLNISNNAAVYGGGMYNDASNPQLSHSIFTQNQASHSGGGMVNHQNSNPWLSHIIFGNNSAAQAGGALWNENSSALLAHVTISDNTAVSGGGVANQASQIQIVNSILWNNQDNSGTTAAAQIKTDNNQATTVTYSIVQGGWAGEGNQDKDPLFIQVENRKTQHTEAKEFHLATNSPAIDAGNNTAIPQDLTDAECKGGDGNTTEVVAIDFDGNSRLLDGNNDGIATVDMGAYEVYSSSEQLVTLTLTVVNTDLAQEGNLSSIQSNLPGIRCGDDCRQDYSYGTEVILIAYNGDNSQFSGWSGDCQGNHNHITLNLTTNMTCEALFTVTKDPTAVAVLPPEANTNPTAEPIVVPEPSATLTDQVQMLPPAYKEIQDSFINFVYNFDGQTRKDITVGPEGNISNVKLVGTNYSQGWISNLQLTANSSLSGGIVSGITDSEGTISYIEFRGAKLTGGFLTGLIINNSPINGSINHVTLDTDAYLWGGILGGNIINRGIIRDVVVAADTKISGGVVTGTIIGQSATTSVLENVRVAAGSCLKNLKLGQGVQLENNVITQGDCSQANLNNTLITTAIPSAGQTFKDVVIGVEGRLDRVVLQGTIRSLGTVANAILAPHSDLIGGTLQGEVSSEGNITDVQLAAGAHVIGGTMQGFIIGDAAQPAKLENLTILAGSYLENVKLGANVQVAEGVIYGKGVERLTKTPTTTAAIITDSVSGNGKVFKDTTIASTGVLTDAILSGTITNLGQISTATLLTGSNLTGGVISDQFTNQGTVKNVQLDNATFTGGELAGQINSTPQSTIQDVTLAPNTVINYGQLQGQIRGDVHYPALLNHVQIKSGTHLENVILGENVQIAEGVTYGDGVRQLEPVEITPTTVIDSLVQAEGQTLSAVTVTESGKLFNSTLTGIITNQGTISGATLLPGTIVKGGYLAGKIISDNATVTDVHLAANSRLIGGKVQGRVQGQGEGQQRARLELVTITPNSYVSNLIIGQQVTNAGTIADCEFQGASLTGGTLAGVTLNTRGGTISNVQLAAGAKIIGGNLMGDITGDPDQPARLENVTIAAGSSLNNVIIDLATTTIAQNVNLGPGVQLINQAPDQLTLKQADYAAMALLKVAPTEYVSKNIVASPTAPHFQSQIHTQQGLQPNHALLTYIQAEEIDLTMTIQVAPEQVGQAADLLMVSSYQSPEQTTYSMRQQNQWVTWNKDPSTLPAAQTYQQLPKRLTVKVADKMDLSKAAGEYTFYVGYRTPEGTIIYNGATPLHFFVESAPPACNLYAVHDEGIDDTQFLKIDLSYLGLKGVMTPLGPLYPHKNIEGLALHPSNPDVLYGTAGTPSKGQKSSSLYTIDRLTGKILSQRPLTVPDQNIYFNQVASLAVNWNDNNLEQLWAWAETHRKNDWMGLIQIDPQTGITTLVKQFTDEDCQARYVSQLEQKSANNDSFQQHYTSLIRRNNDQPLTQLEATSVEKFIEKQCDIQALAWSYNANNQEVPQLYAAGNNTLWIYDHLNTQELQLACVNVVPSGQLIEGLEMQPNGLLLFGIDHRHTKETSIVAYDPKTCRAVKERTFSKKLGYSDIESIVWPINECFNQSWLWPEEESKN